MVNRREFLALVSAGVAARAPQQKADVTLHIGPVEMEIAPRRIVRTTGYNGTVPGPVLRLPDGKTVTIEVFNDTKFPELTHWHGLFAPSEMDGAMEEGTPHVPPGGSRRYTFIAHPTGTRWYHTHMSAGRDLKRSTYSGQFGFLCVDAADNPGRYDAEVFLALHGWDAYMSAGDMGEGSLEVAYNWYSVNSHSLGHGVPIRVRDGQRVLFRILNANATLAHQLSLPGHKFQVIALDGNAVPNPREVETLALGPGERVDAVVTMNQPGVWVLGELNAKARNAGLGVVVEYAGSTGTPQWTTPASAAWDYTIFGNAARTTNAEPIPLAFKQKFAGHNWMDAWTINGKVFPKTDPIVVHAGRRYRLIFDNQSDDAHPVHLHRHSFELTKVAGQATSGVYKDVVMVPARSQVEAEFVAANPGPTLFHCHNQLHMDNGFMALIRYA